MTRRAADIYLTIYLKQVSSFTLGKKQNDFCQVKFNKSGLNFNIHAYGGSMVIRFTIHSTIKSLWIHHLHLIAIATLCYILLHHRYMLLLTCIIVTYCYSTPLLIDTSFYAILTKKRCCLGFVWGSLSFAGDFGKVVEDEAEV